MACLNLSDCVPPFFLVLLDHLLDRGCCVSAIIPLSKFPLKAHHPLLLLLFAVCHYNP